MTDEVAERIAKALESIAASLLKAAQPPMLVPLDSFSPMPGRCTVCGELEHGSMMCPALTPTSIRVVDAR